MLRLAMWPTDVLWDFADKAMQEFEQQKKSKEDSLVRRGTHWNYMVGMHFRCGDMGYTHAGEYDKACMHTTDNLPAGKV